MDWVSSSPSYKPRVFRGSQKYWWVRGKKIDEKTY
jgi:hypothetical protein